MVRNMISGDVAMKEIKIAQAPVFTSPNPMTFICSKKADGKTNMATIAFWTYASTNPGKVVFSLNKGAYTLELLAKNKEVVITIPGISLAGTLIACGTSSGRDTDKVEKFGIEMQKLDGTDIEVPKDTRLAIVAEVCGTVDADDHVLHICNVKNVYADESIEAVFGWNGYAELAAAQKK